MSYVFDQHPETTLLTNQKLGIPDFEGILEVTADITEKHKNILGRVFVKFYNSAFSSAEDTVANHL